VAVQGREGSWEKRLESDDVSFTIYSDYEHQAIKISVKATAGFTEQVNLNEGEEDGSEFRTVVRVYRMKW